MSYQPVLIGGTGWNLPNRFPIALSMSRIRDIMKLMKPVDFHPRALEFIRAQSPSIRRQVGEALRDLQKGANLGMPLSRPMGIVAPGVHELRVKGEGATVRVFYYVRRSDAIIVFHAFQKKSQRTPSRETYLARQRLQEVLDEAIGS